jgi:hypothetical protein
MSSPSRPAANIIPHRPKTTIVQKDQTSFQDASEQDASKTSRSSSPTSTSTPDQASSTTPRTSDPQHSSQTSDIILGITQNVSVTPPRTLATIYQFNQSKSNSVPETQIPRFTFTSSYEPAINPGEIRPSASQDSSVSFNGSSLPILSTQDHEFPQPLHAVFSEEKIVVQPSDKIQTQDEDELLEPFFTKNFQRVLKNGIDIVNKVDAAIAQCVSSSESSNDLERLLKDARQLGTFQTTDTRTIAILGDSGQGNWAVRQRKPVESNMHVGKSSLINSLLDLSEIAKTVG